jgi:hypothetical protein
MGSLRKRLEKLEVRQPRRGSGGIPNSLNRYLEMLTGEAGAPYGPEEAEDDRELLRKLDEEWPGNEGVRQELEEEAHARLWNYYYEKEGDR